MTQAQTTSGPPWFHLLPGAEPAVFLVNGSMLFDIGPDLMAGLARTEPWALAEMRSFNTDPPAAPATPPPIAALSLNVAQSCNLACTYCYADEGRFGRAPSKMEPAVAFAAIDRLIAQARGRVTVGFIGGEPFLNRRLIHESVGYAKDAAARAGLAVGFSVTTNATLLTDEDLRLLRDEAFTVTVSLDGGPDQNRQRRDRRQADSTARALACIVPLLNDPGGARIAARASITRDDLDVAGRVDWLSEAGFAEIGVSPVRTGPSVALRLTEDDWPRFLGRMIEAAEAELTSVFSGATPRFSNLWTALKAIHRGAARPLPCGSVATYLSVGADGSFASCHRTVGDDAFRMGSADEGFDDAGRAQFLAARIVDRQEPCRSCWARYLCGGGCHAEVTEVGRAGCDYIRGWLEFALWAYRDVMSRRPELLIRSET